MANESGQNLDYENAIKIAKDIYWVGFYDKPSGLHCNPFLVIDGEEAVVIDGGSRPDFPTVMMKILQTGINPHSIVALIYHHYDPDLCGSIPNFEDIIGRQDLKIISDKENNMFIRHYSVSSNLLSLESINHQFTFSSGRALRFINTPYSHSAGSFVTLDRESGVLFTSDLFGSYGATWELFLRLAPECRSCLEFPECHHGISYCALPDILRFHEGIMTSEKALRYAMKTIMGLSFSMVAPQHGSVLPALEDIKFISERLLSLEGVGIDGVIPKAL